MKLCA